MSEDIQPTQKDRVLEILHRLKAITHGYKNRDEIQEAIEIVRKIMLNEVYPGELEHQLNLIEQYVNDESQKHITIMCVNTARRILRRL